MPEDKILPLTNELIKILGQIKDRLGCFEGGPEGVFKK